MFLRYVFFLLITFSQIATAAPFRHSIVYRVDNRDFDTIKESGGFLPRLDGEPDYDLTHHFAGESVDGSRSAFISTSYLLQDVVTFSAYLVPMINGRYSDDFVTYIYAIRPNDRFYDVDLSLRTALARYEEDTFAHYNIDRLIRRYNDMHEIVSLGEIPEGRIMSYARLDGRMLNQYGINGSSPLFSELFWASRWIDNTSYNHSFDNDGSSIQPYPSTGISNGTEVIAQRDSNSPTVRLANTCEGVDLSKNMRMLNKTVECGNFSIKRKIYDEYTLGVILTIINDDSMSNSGSGHDEL